MAAPRPDPRIVQKIDRARDLLRQGKFRAALGPLAEVEKRVGRSPGVLNLKAQALAGAGNRTAAIASLRTSLDKMPRQPAVLQNLGFMLFEEGQYTEATDLLEQAVEMSETPQRPAVAVARLFFLLERLDKAEHYADLALNLDPNIAQALAVRGHVANARADADRARDAFQAALRLDPVDPDSHFGLSELLDYTPDHPHIAQMNTVLRSTSLPPKPESQLRFALGNALEKAGQLAEAAEAFRKANSLRRQETGFDIEKARKRFADLAADVPAPGAPGLAVTPLTERRPLFIVGLPRSGTTLTERILGSHSQIEPCGELPDMARAVDQMQANPQRALSHRLSDIRRAYLKARPEGVEAVWFTDKKPMNFANVGYILSAFPEAKVIHLRRHPFHTCWSIFKRPFDGPGSDYSFGEEDLVAYFKLYADLMAQWQARFPDRLLTVIYEELVSQPREQTARMLEFAGLPWEEACLDFHNSGQVSNTASRYQVQKPIFRNSADKAERFRPYFPGFAAALDDLALPANKILS